MRWKTGHLERQTAAVRRDKQMANTSFQEKKHLPHVSSSLSTTPALGCKTSIVAALLPNGRHWKWAKFGQYLLQLNQEPNGSERTLFRTALCTASLSFIHWKITEQHWKLCNETKLKEFHGENTIHVFFWAGLLINTCSFHSALHIISLF